LEKNETDTFCPPLYSIPFFGRLQPFWTKNVHFFRYILNRLKYKFKIKKLKNILNDLKFAPAGAKNNFIIFHFNHCTTFYGML